MSHAIPMFSRSWMVVANLQVLAASHLLLIILTSNPGLLGGPQHSVITAQGQS